MTSYSNPRLSALVHGKRVSALLGIEKHATRGERATRTTTVATKKITYALKARIVDGDDGKTYIAERTPGHIHIRRGNLYTNEVIYSDDARYHNILRLFDEEPNS
jgi:hypothetical protein